MSPLIPENIVDEIKSRNEIVSVVEQYVTLDHKSAANYFGLCPFHKEDTPSFSVSPSKQIFYCFGCHKGGDVIGFIKEIEKVSYPQALRILAERAGIDLPEPDDEAWKIKNDKIKIQQTILLEAARWYYRNLIGNQGQIAQQYLQKRAISAATAKKFGIGYAPDNWDGLLKHLKSLSYSEGDLLESGLFKRTKQGNLIDLFRSRLMFPIFDALGKVIAFGGRVLDEGMPKYINSPETLVYTKGRHLYALNLAKNSRADNLIIAEGYLDVIAMHQAGVDQAVASLGTALTEQQATLLRKYKENIIIGFDADAAGQQAAVRSLEILSAKGMNVSVLQVPDGKDPDDYIKKNGPERFRALIEKALPLIDFKLLTARRANENERGLDIIGYQDAACDILAKVDNGIVRELYAEKLAQTLHTSQDSVISEIERRRSAPRQDKDHDMLRQQLRQKQENAKAKQAANNDQVTKDELFLLVLLASNPDCWSNLQEKPQPVDFSQGTMRNLYVEAMPLLAQAELDTVKLLELAGDTVIRGRDLSDLIASASMRIDELIDHQDVNKVALGWLMNMKLHQLKNRKNKLNKELEESSDSQKTGGLRRELLELSQQIAELKDNLSKQA